MEENTNQQGEGAKIPIEVNTIDKVSKLIPASFMGSSMRGKNVSQENWGLETRDSAGWFVVRCKVVQRSYLVYGGFQY